YPPGHRRRGRLGPAQRRIAAPGRHWRLPAFGAATAVTRGVLPIDTRGPQFRLSRFVKLGEATVARRDIGAWRDDTGRGPEDIREKTHDRPHAQRGLWRQPHRRGGRPDAGPPRPPRPRAPRG